MQREIDIKGSINQFVVDTVSNGEPYKEGTLHMFAKQRPAYYNFAVNKLDLEWIGSVGLLPVHNAPRTPIRDPHQGFVYQETENAGFETIATLTSPSAGVPIARVLYSHSPSTRSMTSSHVDTEHHTLDSYGTDHMESRVPIAPRDQSNPQTPSI